jgi:hypothetical protein
MSSRRPLRLVPAAAVLAALLGVAAPLHAQPAAPAAPAPASSEGRRAIILRTVIEERGQRRLPSADEPELQAMAQMLDGLLGDTAQDLGLSVDLTERSVPDPSRLEESDLGDEARKLDGVLVAPVLAPEGRGVTLRLTLADAASRPLRVRVERVARGELPVRAVIMLRDLVGDAGCPPGCRRGVPGDGGAGTRAPGELATPARSAGRATLVVNATIFGGLAGYSVQRSSGSDDPRLLYPLLAVGAGVGLGGSIIVSEEWDVGIGDAWYLAAAAWWPTLAGHLIYEGRFAEHAGEADDERWAFGLVSGTTGIAIGSVFLSISGVGEGAAMLAHSGGGLGAMFGGLTELFARGDIYRTPFAGIGYGAGLGWLAAAAFARVQVPTARVLTVDLGAVLGGLGGAALASPLLFDSPEATEQRVWLGATAGAAVVGAGLAFWLTRPSKPVRGELGPGGGEPGLLAGIRGTPLFGVIGESQVAAASVPIYGLGWRGPLP